MTASYDKRGISFLYPENWKILDDGEDEWPRTVSVESPSGGYWTLHVYPEEFQPHELCEQALEAMRGEYEQVESQDVEEELFDFNSVGFDISFFCLDFLVTCRIRSFRAGRHPILLISQAESRDFEQQKLIYAAMTKSFLDNWG